MQGGSRANFWGELILQLRSENGLSQRQLALRAVVNRSTLRRIEEGTARCDIDLIERLLAVAGYELEAIESASRAAQQRKIEKIRANPLYRSRLAAAMLNQSWPDRG